MIAACRIPIKIFGREKIARHVHLVLVGKGYLLHGRILAGVKIGGAVGHILRQSRFAHHGHHAAHGGNSRQQLFHGLFLVAFRAPGSG